MRRGRSSRCPPTSWRRWRRRAAADDRGGGEVDGAGHRRGAAWRRPGLSDQARRSTDDDLALDEPGASLLSSLRGDCHSHSDWSDGGSPILEMAEAARDLGHDYLVLTDHSARLTVAHGLNEERLREQLEVVAEVNEQLAPFRLLTGMEVDILEDGSLDLDPDMLGDLDVVVASVHSKLRMDAKDMTARMVAAIESPHTDILGHCTGRLITGRGRPQSTFDAEAVFAACAATGTAVEINSRPERQDPPEDLLRLAVEFGCSFAIDTDAHAPGQLEWLGRGCRNAVTAEVPFERIVNRRSADELVAWAASHDAPATSPDGALPARRPSGLAHVGQAHPRPARERTACSTSRSGTASAASSSGTATRSSWAAATRSR